VVVAIFMSSRGTSGVIFVMPGLFSRVPVNNRASVATMLKGAIPLAVLGLIASFLFFTVSSEEKCTGHLWNKECVDVPIPMSERLPFLLATIVLVGVIAFCAWGAFRLSTMAGPSRRYHAILTGIEHISVQRISAITDVPPARVRREIQELIDTGEIDDFYLDVSKDEVVSRKYVPKTSHKTVVVCTSCKGRNELIVGITKSCEFCRQPLLLHD
jgi:hypothetical protein